MPLLVSLNHVLVEQIEFRAADAPEPVVVERVLLRGQVSSTELAIVELDVKAPTLSLQANVRTLVANHYETKGALSWDIASSQDGPLRGSANVQGNRKRLNFELQAGAKATRHGHFVLSGGGYYGAESLVLSGWEISSPQRDTQLSLDGTLTDLLSKPSADIALRWQSLQWPLPEAREESKDSPQNVSEIEMDNSAEEQAALRSKTGELKLRAVSSDDGFSVEELTGRGQLQGRPFVLDALVDYDGKRLDVSQFSMRSGESQLSAQGEMGDELDFEWDFASPDLSALYVDLQGTIDSKGTLAGKWPWPRIDAVVNAQELRFGQYALKTLALDAQLDLDEANSQAKSELSLEASQLVVGENTWDSINMTLDGVRSAHTIELLATGNALVVDAALRGGLDQNAWAGTLQRATLSPEDLGAWKLQQPHALHIDEQNQTLERGCWSSGEAQLCLNAGRIDGAVEAAVSLDDFAFGYLQSVMPPDVNVSGAISGKANFTQDASAKWLLDANFTTTQTTITQQNVDASKPDPTLVVEPGTITATGRDEDVVAALNFPFAAGGGLQGDVTITPVAGAYGEAALGGEVHANIPSLDFIAALSPEIVEIVGALNMDFSLAGTLDAPLPSGKATVENAQFELATPGLALTDVNFLVTSDETGSIALKGGAVSDGGEINLAGSAQLKRAAASDASSMPLLDGLALQVTGSEFQVWNTKEARLWASPSLELKMVDDTLHVTGEVEIPRARITPTELPPSAVGVTSDQIIITADSPEEGEGADATGPKIQAQVKVVLGEDVAVDGFGFKGRLVGALNVKQVPGEPVLANGELNVEDGEYRAYGQGLVVERGQILFAGGDISNPALNVRAQRRPGSDIIVGVDVRGVADKPELTIFSDPAMSSSNQLSWLVLGRPFENTSGAEGDYIAQAALLIGLHGGDYLAKGIGEKLGFDTVGVETGSGEAGAASDVNQAALVVGKYITPKLYVSYGVGLLEAISTVKLRYLFSDNWNLVSESSAIASGGDISYTFEK